MSLLKRADNSAIDVKATNNNNNSNFTMMPLVLLADPEADILGHGAGVPSRLLQRLPGRLHRKMRCRSSRQTLRLVTSASGSVPRGATVRDVPVRQHDVTAGFQCHCGACG